MLLGQYFGGRHQRALPAGIDANGGRQRSHHGFAAAHIALQQAVHGDVALQVAGDFFAYAALRGCEGKGQGGQQLFVQAAGAHGQGGGVPCFALQAGLGLRKLLSQQLLGLQAQPGGVAVVLQRGYRRIGCRVVQVVQRLLQGPGRLPQLFVQRLQGLGRNGLLQQTGFLCLLQAIDHGAPQIGLRQLARRRVDGRERIG